MDSHFSRRTPRFFQTIGIGLVCLSFLVALGRILLRSHRESDAGRVVLRLAHWQLEKGIEAAIDACAREYEREHPDVSIRQLLIPEKIYPNWSTTQLIGGTAPDLVQLGKGITEERIARYFRSISEFVDDPNPYNVGTHLEGIPWRQTFVDGMEGGFYEGLTDYYAASSFVSTVRVYYNKKLMREILGADRVPESYEQFLDLCRKASAHGRQSGRVLLPIAGSSYNAPILVDGLLASQIHRKQWESAKVPLLRPASPDLSYLTGAWNFHDPAARTGLELMRELSGFMQPGFLQLNREDALLYFVQGRALMIATGSWDSTSIRFAAPFDVGVFRLPQPSFQNPRFRPNMMGPIAEEGLVSYGGFGLYRGCAHPEVALDFLRFLTSYRGNQLFAKVSQWPPIIRGVEPSEEARPFMPFTRGYPPAHLPTGTPEAYRIWSTNLHKLFNEAVPLDDFIDAVEEQMPQALRRDVLRLQQERLRSLCSEDVAGTAQRMLVRRFPENRVLAFKARAQPESQLRTESQFWIYQNLLEDLNQGDNRASHPHR
jgi:raffinose/stachyose/melibiose transport system substrate-binding protein